MVPFLVDWWHSRQAYRAFDAEEAALIHHAERLYSAPLMAMYNKPQSVINLQALHDRVYALLGVTP